MTRLLLLSVFISSVVPALALEPADLHGTWTLASGTTTLVATGEVSDAYGPKPKGYLTYTPEGRMSALIAWSGRPKAADVTKISDQDRVALFQTFTAYGGTFSVSGSTVTHHVDVSLNEVWTGLDQIRHARLEGDTLVIRTDPMPRRPDNKLSIYELKWTKLKTPPKDNRK